MSTTNSSRQPSFMMLGEQREPSEEIPSTSGVASRLPASKRDQESNRSLVDLTPSGEVQMRVVNYDLGFMTPRFQTGGSVKNSTNSNFQNLGQELEMHREAERRILGFLESHSDDGGRQLNFGEYFGGGDNVSYTCF